MKKRILAVILCLALALTLALALASCGGGGDETGNEGGTVPPPAPTGDLALIEDGKANFQFVL